MPLDWEELLFSIESSLPMYMYRPGHVALTVAAQKHLIVTLLLITPLTHNETPGYNDGYLPLLQLKCAPELRSLLECRNSEPSVLRHTYQALLYTY